MYPWSPSSRSLRLWTRRSPKGSSPVTLVNRPFIRPVVRGLFRKYHSHDRYHRRLFGNLGVRRTHLSSPPPLYHPVCQGSRGVPYILTYGHRHQHFPPTRERIRRSSLHTSTIVTTYPTQSGVQGPFTHTRDRTTHRGMNPGTFRHHRPSHPGRGPGILCTYPWPSIVVIHLIWSGVRG